MRHRFWLPLLCVALAAATAAAQDAPAYPTRPIRLIVAFSAGGTTDFVARLIADKVKGPLGQAVVVENKPGANGAIGADFVSKAEPDGYTLFFSTAGALAINPSMRTDLPYDPIKGFTPIVPTARNTVLLAINTGLGIDTAQQMIARAKEKPGTITVAITGVGAISHLAVEMLQSAAGIKLQTVPYRGAGPAIADLIGGQVSAMSAEVPVIMPQIKAGKAKVLAVSAQARSDVIPDVPTFAELGYPDVVADNWSGVLAPPKTPAAIVAKLNAAFNAVVKDPEVRRRLADNGVSTIGGTPEDLATLIASETARWRKVVAETGIKDAQ
ncbi:MAG TPA: tripartite tricarboxylate transporter substrate binding protein [Xanthobacteraceae bacterium]|nr:tripartite tricarboxylate transporter substrate binding protein [Xanthobacteraceae bacterium]